jgi:hypothetical protein
MFLLSVIANFCGKSRESHRISGSLKCRARISSSFWYAPSQNNHSSFLPWYVDLPISSSAPMDCQSAEELQSHKRSEFSILLVVLFDTLIVDMKNFSLTSTVFVEFLDCFHGLKGFLVGIKDILRILYVTVLQ